MSTTKSFLERIRTEVLIGDGALGTELVARGANVELALEKQNLIAPELVSEIHSDYIKAGSVLIETNTFGANRLTLAQYGEETELAQIVREGVQIARQAAGTDIFVAGSIGPLPVPEGEPLEPDLRTAVFAEQVGLLLENGVDVLMFESFSDADELTRAVQIARSMTGIPIIAQAAYDMSGFTANGTNAGDVGRMTLDAGADVVGANCGYGVPSIAAAVKRFGGLDVPLSAFINAGFPEQVDGRMMYMSSPEYLARRAADLVEKGVRLIGGCCGTNPASIQAMKQAIIDKKAPTPKHPSPEKIVISPTSKPTREPSAEKAQTWRILVELDPPTTPDLGSLLEGAKRLKAAGADAITVADYPLASVRVDTLTTAIAIQREADIPVIPHLTGRDRNKIALQSTFMGAYVAGIEAFLCVTGDPIRFCQQPNTSGVFDVNSIGLTGMLSDFNRSHRELDPNFCPISAGVALNPNVRNLNGQIDKLRRKVDAGAKFALTQPIYSQDRLEPLLEALAAADINIPIYTGIMPLTSFKNAEFIHNEVPGIHVPDFIRETMAKYEAIADQRTAAMQLIREFILQIQTATHGFYLITPRNRVELVTPLIETINSKPVPD